MISNRTGKDPVPAQQTLTAAPNGRKTNRIHHQLHRILHHPALYLRAMLRLSRHRRALATALLAGSATAAAAVTVVATNHFRTPDSPLAAPRPVATPAEALTANALLAAPQAAAPAKKRHRIAEALEQLKPLARLDQGIDHIRDIAQQQQRRSFAELQRLSDLHPLRGLATWYGSVLHGHKTASGEAFDETAMTAAHRTLPLGTVVRVTDLRTARSVIVRINDRGTLAPGRVIDLSSAAAAELGILRSGTAQVKLEVLPPERT